MSFTVKAITPKGIYFSKEVSEVYLPSVHGPIGIYQGYAPGYIVLKDSGIISLKENGVQEYYAIFGGAVEIKGDMVSILSDDIEDGYSIDMARAIAARDRANDRIASKDPSIDFKRAQAALGRALTRIKVKNLGLGEN